jgi:hypothetical protein
MSLLGSFVGFSDVTEEMVSRFTLLGGLKLPSGNSRRLAEELPGNPHSFDLRFGAPFPLPRPGAIVPFHNPGGNPFAVQTGIHGHDLALGSGSTDGIVGTQLFVSWRRLFLTASEQYMLRTEGSFDYTYANDFIWAGGPGAFVLVDHDYTLGVQAVVSGETKGNDTINGVKTNDTAVTELFVGPAFRFTWGTSLGAEIDAGIPVVENNTSLQIVPNYRLIGGLTWQF